MLGNQRQEKLTQGQEQIQRDYRWITDMDYKEHTVHWTECRETTTKSDGKIEKSRFVHLTDIQPSYRIVPEISAAGRRRWKIENEGFNIFLKSAANLLLLPLISSVGN